MRPNIVHFDQKLPAQFTLNAEVPFLLVRINEFALEDIVPGVSKKDWEDLSVAAHCGAGNLRRRPPELLQSSGEGCVERYLLNILLERRIAARVSKQIAINAVIKDSVATAQRRLAWATR